MSIIQGTGTYLETSMQDDHLVKAAAKLAKQIVSVTEDGHALVEPMKNGQDARFMVEGDYQLSRRWSWRIYNGPIPPRHRVYVGCGEANCVEPTHLYAYKAERSVRPRLGMLEPVG